ncbi:TnsA endonuclease N-terminal domain-containing protein [Clostridium thermopalmarium]|uniref:Transposon Tn7 transposition protein TnsA n=1 Tax=Clostridium thermopalmarium DSM 5974 TaxID=1121340 RepID=A0A2T0AMM2_9CLOT|nr:TnsA endonuclease N-terminal domain-containing protein [Clostridium thermopalmarium]PRR70118.1 Transposon Tn7 transposition protein TnsA [Clostridium thermopalmarium DSM 5974]PVZ23133.1 TnsA endonuclease-like protein [Clostridium thermopalmarium DSM 5974]
MSRKKKVSMREQMEKKIKKGAGLGTLKMYVPFIKTQDVSSRGRSTRIKSWKTGRVHHFLSDLERDYFLLLEWEDQVLDIREQFPLLPIEMTINIADLIGVRHPTDPKTKEPVVMTTDFLITLKQHNKVFDIARALKYTNELDKYRTIEKFEIERRFWTYKGINWGIVTEMEINATMADNIRELHQSYWLCDDPSFNQKDVDVFYEFFIQMAKTYPELPVIYLTKEFDRKTGCLYGTGIQILKYLLAHKIIKTDMTRKISYRERKLGDFSS